MPAIVVAQPVRFLLNIKRTTGRRRGHQVEGLALVTADRLGMVIGLHLDGPLSLFSATQKYGLQLAMFLPTVAAGSATAIATLLHRKQDATGRAKP